MLNAEWNKELDIPNLSKQWRNILTLILTYSLELRLELMQPQQIFCIIRPYGVCTIKGMNKSLFWKCNQNNPLCFYSVLKLYSGGK